MALNKSELVAAIATKTGHTATDVAKVIDAMFEVVSAEVAQGGKVTIPGYISFERTARAARQGRNPQTGATIQIAASNSVKIAAGSKLKAAVK